jgi:hypothetical protein
MPDKQEWTSTKENGFSPDPDEVQKLLRVVAAKIASGEATGALVLLCDGDGLVYMGEELPRSMHAIAAAILCLEFKAREFSREWCDSGVVGCERPNGLEIV